MNAESFAILRLTLVHGLGPVGIRRLIEVFGSAQAALGASPALIHQATRCGKNRSSGMAQGIRESEDLAKAELDLAEKLGVSIHTRADEGFPELLAPLPDAPVLLYVRGRLDAKADRYPIAMVGSRHCSQYGLEQAARFASVLAASGLTVVSGGARGIDSSAHRGALAAPGRTIAVLGCGLAHCYPEENAGLFSQIAEAGAVISELPLNVAPKPENFPARNRIISGLSLGVLVIEAGERSGALITARLAAEDHGREVMALPGRVDSTTCRGSLRLLRDGGASIVLEPGDVLSLLETPGRHAHAGTHASRYSGAHVEAQDESQSLFGRAPNGEQGTIAERVLAALIEPKTVDELSRETGVEAGSLRATLTVLEIQRAVVREGSRLVRVAGNAR
ncbi:MAG: DNA-protecting protein DprA [Phycisphaerales bacterium]|nr:DNA-protecting protein DprA [Phycisphaerales bacterium]